MANAEQAGLGANNITDAHGKPNRGFDRVQGIGGGVQLPTPAPSTEAKSDFQILSGAGIGTGPETRPESFVSAMEERPFIPSTEGVLLRPAVVRTSDAGNATNNDGNIPGYTHPKTSI